MFARINSPKAGILEIDIDSFNAPDEILQGNPEGPVDTTVLLFTPEGQRLAETKGSRREEDAAQDPYLLFEIEANTDYLLAITGDGNENIDPFATGSGSGSSDLGEYVLNAQLLTLAEKTNRTDDTTTSGGVRAIALGETIAGEISEDGDFVIGARDVDLYRFVPTQSGSVNLRTDTSLEFSADTFLRFFIKLIR